MFTNNTTSRYSELMLPAAWTDGNDDPRLIDELVPSATAVIDQILIGRKLDFGGFGARQAA